MLVRILLWQIPLPFSRTRICPCQKMHSAFLQLLQQLPGAGAVVRQTHRLLHLQPPEAAQMRTWACPALSRHLRSVPLSVEQVPWQLLPGAAPWAPDLQQPLPGRQNRPLPVLQPASRSPPALPRCRRLYQAGHANYRDCLVYYLFPDPSSSHQTLTSHRQVLRPRYLARWTKYSGSFATRRDVLV